MDIDISDPKWEKLYGNQSNPYFIYTPRWIETSAGIKALHLLCHSLNRTGFRAYLVMIEPRHSGECRINPSLLTPILTQEIADEYFARKITPIVIYSETIPGNPLGADFVVRYLMNFVGHLGGQTKFDPEEHLIAYSNSIAQDFTDSRILPQTLFLPAIDPRDFIFNLSKEKFQLTYAAKYRLFVGEPPKIGELKNIEILRDGPKRQDRTLVRELISKATVTYVFENTAIIIESILSGTPVIMVKNNFFEKLIADQELGLSITENDQQLREIDVTASRDKYLESIDLYFDGLEVFANQTQQIASTIKVKKPTLVPDLSGSPLTLHRARLAVQIYKNLGLRALIRVTYYFILRRIPTKNFPESKFRGN